MRDVIVVGAGGGGPVVAKELAARGLDVLLLEAGPAWEQSERQWTHYENAANNPASGVFRFGPGDRSQPPWARDLPQDCFLWQTAGVGGSTVHYFANSPRAMPGRLPRLQQQWVRQRGRALRIPRVDPVLRVGRAHAARADGSDGNEGGTVPARVVEARACRLQTSKDICVAVVPAARERDPATAGDGRPHEQPRSGSRIRRRAAARSAATVRRAASSRSGRRATCGRNARRTRATCRWR